MGIRMRRLPALVGWSFLFGLGGCGNKPSATAAHASQPATSAVAMSRASPDAGAASAPARDAGASFSLPEIPLPAAPRLGPLRIEGYPSKLAVGMSDAAESFGFTRDGAFANCMFDICCRDGQSRCELLKDDGSKHLLLSPVLFDDDPKLPGREKRTVKELRQFVKDEGLASLVFKGMEDTKAPPPSGDWAYGGEMTLVVHETPPREIKKPSGEVEYPPGMVKVGGRLEGESTVFVYFPPRPELCEYPTTCFEMQMNALVVSPDRRDFGFLTYIRHSSHGSTITPSRLGTDAFAAMVLNATGHDHHQRKDYARATPLFTRAVYADPTKEVYAYNLACALARQNDDRARHALALAIRLGGAKVIERARKDADFASVKDKGWFKSATGQ
jgi:hypothetical protein